MGYFSNGTEGFYLEEQCHNCLHGLNDEMLCPVALVQLTYNYSQIGNDDLQAALNMLIDEHGICLMKHAIEKAGIRFDFSEREQLSLL